MGIYLINHVYTREGIDGHEALRQLKKTIERHGGRCCFDDGAQHVEGGRARSQVLVEFANIIAANSWYTSADYANVSRIYLDNAIDLALVDGISPDFTMAGFAPNPPLSPSSWNPMPRGNVNP